MNLLGDPLVGVRLRSGVEILSLPEILAALAADDVLDFPHLRAHQRHPWHALLVQLGALACVRGGLPDLSTDAEAWRRGLRALTPDFADDAPWHLVSPADAPGFLQPVAGPLAALKNEVPTPDALDMLVTSRNHDIKRRRMRDAAADDWLFALVALQTMEGFLGAGNYGISRMNGGFGNRPGLSLAPRGGMGAHIMRDVGRLVAARGHVLEAQPHYAPDGLALLWLVPWDGTQALNPKMLDPYYVEICRRVRLVAVDGRIAARAGGSKVARVGMVKTAGGLTGDPWTPIDARQAEPKALTIDARGFDYRRLSEILFSPSYIPALLQEAAEDETGTGWTLVARALARGQGKTEGYHERRIPIPAQLAGRMSSVETRAHLGLLARERIDDAGAVRGALRFALMTLFQNGPDTFQPQDPASARHADPFLDRFQAEVDRDFFEALFAEAELAADGDAAAAQRRAWLFEFLRRAERLLRAADAGSPHSAVRHYRASVRAGEALARGFFGNKLLKGRIGKDDALA
jgi:CRISPR system Cascade subunit CasA